MRYTRLAVTVALTAGVFAAGCERQLTPKVSGPTAFMVNGQPVSQTMLVQASIQQRLQAGSAPDEAALERQVRDNVIATILLAQAAERAGLDRIPAVTDELLQARRATLAQAFVRQVASRPVSDKEQAAAYAAWAAKSRQEYAAAHILVATKAAALGLIAQLHAGADFGRLAASLSQDPATAAKGGHLGWLRPGALEAPLAAALTRLNAGEISADPVRSRQGWHVLKVSAVRESPPDPPAKVQARLTRQILQDRVKQEIETVRQRAQVTLRP